MEPEEPVDEDAPRVPRGVDAGPAEPSNAWDAPLDPSSTDSSQPSAPAWLAFGSLVVAVVALVALVVVIFQLNSARSDLDRSEAAVEALEDDKRDIEFERDTFRAERDEAEKASEERTAEADEAEQARAELDGLLGRVFVETLALEFPGDRAFLNCILDDIGTVTAGQLMLLSLEPDAIDFSELRVAVEFVDAYENCGGDPADLDAASGDAIDPGDVDGPGDDPELDALHGACADGDMVACDELYFASPFDSEYERFGLTCGGRVDDLDFDEYCVDVQVPA